MQIFEIINDFIVSLIELLGTMGAVLGCLFIVIESIVPILPLAVFITLNFITFGNVIGFIISWVFTIVGCMMSFYIFRKGFNERFHRLTSNKVKLQNLMVAINNLSFGQLVVLIAIPFTPAFLVNIAAGLSDITPKKFLCSLLIGKLSLVYFWGYIGVSLIESFKNPIILIKIGVIVLVLYLISRLINKKINL